MTARVLSAFAAFLFPAILFVGTAAAQTAPVPPIGRVVDTTGTLTQEQRTALAQRLEAFEKKKGSQIAVVMVPTTGDETIEQYALRVAEQWKLGRKGVDDGALLAIAKNDRAMRIEVGYGLEGPLNDAVSKRIVADIVAPRFRQGDFFGGIAAGTDAMMQVIEGEPLPAPSRTARPTGGGAFQMLPVLLVAAIVVGGILRAVLGRALGSVATGGAVGVLAWVLAGTLMVGIIAGVVALLFTLMGGMGRRGGYIGYPGGFAGHRGGLGGGFGGGFGGGGFRGGGGGFGGGGASGRW